jgi:tetratricopeptide (TPR) repeat protein
MRIKTTHKNCRLTLSFFGAAPILRTAMKILRSLVAWTLLAGGCAGLNSQTDFLAGRRALLRGEPENALGYFDQVAQREPAFVSASVSPPKSIWTYVGRAHYNSGRYDAARSAFEKALSHRSDDHVARLYLGLTLLRPAASPPPANAFQLQEVTFALREGVEPKRVATLARSRGIAFDVTKETESQLRNAGADNFLLGELRGLGAETKGKSNEARRAQGAKELGAALAGLADWLNGTIYYSPQGKFWDPTEELRKQIQLTMKQAAAPADWDAAMANAEWLGYRLEEESDRARRDETEERNRQLRR